jgi:hypothetical protein
MKVTKFWMQNKYDTFKHLIFKGYRMPNNEEVTFCEINVRMPVGRCQYKKIRFLGVNTEFQIMMNTRYDMSETQLEDVLLHEMIHLYLGYNNINDVNHGYPFQNLSNKINKEYGRHITTFANTTELVKKDYADSTEEKIALLHINGKMGVILYPRRATLEDIKNDISRFGIAKSAESIEGLVLVGCPIISSFKGHRLNSCSLSYSFINEETKSELMKYVAKREKYAF